MDDRATRTSLSPSGKARFGLFLRRFGSLAFVGGALLALPALARPPEDVFAGTIRVYSERPPEFRSDVQANAWYRTAATEQVARSHEGDWAVDVVAFLEDPIDDFEVTLLFYDVSDGGRRFVRSTTAMIHDRDARIVRKRVTLREPEFHPRRWYEVVVTARRTERARPARFFTDGVVDTGPQVVTFDDP